MADGQPTEAGPESALQSLRRAFASGAYDEVLASLARIGGPAALAGGARIEAVALAARAHIALGAKRDGRELLKTIWGRSLKHPRQYRNLAIACLELEDYRRATQLSAKAAELADERRTGAKVAGTDASA